MLKLDLVVRDILSFLMERKPDANLDVPHVLKAESSANSAWMDIYFRIKNVPNVRKIVKLATAISLVHVSLVKLDTL